MKTKKRVMVLIGGMVFLLAGYKAVGGAAWEPGGGVRAGSVDGGG
jgi:hypothetical protein